MVSVTAVILTYNRRELLTQCLDAVFAQTVEVGRITIVDNGGTDGTADWVAERFADSVELARLPENIGASGGFNRAVRLGYDCGGDRIWLMDDDVIPAPDALERLIEADAFLTERGVSAPFVISTAWTQDGKLTNVPTVDDSTRNELSYPVWPSFLEHALIPIRRATFVSILLKREVVKRHGLPLAQMFMWGEDTEYTLRITEHQQQGYLVGNSHVQHVRASPGFLDITTERDPVRVGWHFFLRRNQMYNARRFQGRRAAARKFRQSMLLALKLLLKGEFTKAKIIASGNLAGLTFNPKAEGVDGVSTAAALRTALPATP